MLDFIDINANQNPSACVIWLHGLGADGFDFEPVVQILNLPHIRFILPHAPYQKISMNNGYEMRAWYDLYSLDKQGPQDAEGIIASAQSMHALIDHAMGAGITARRIALAGFSQGGAIALHTALRYPQQLAGVLALSTYLPLSHQLDSEKASANQDTPIFMAHGRYDEIITLDTCLHSREKLLDAQYNVEWHEYAMAHTVNAVEVEDIRHFLQRILPE